MEKKKVDMDRADRYVWDEGDLKVLSSEEATALEAKIKAEKEKAKG